MSIGRQAADAGRRKAAAVPAFVAADRWPPASAIVDYFCANVLVAIQQAFTVIGMPASGFFSPKAACLKTTRQWLGLAISRQTGFGSLDGKAALASRQLIQTRRCRA